MKSPLLLILTFFIATGTSLFKAEPTKRALIVAIGNYPASSGWSTISSVNDIDLIKNTLKAQGFTDFAVVQEAEATKENIKAAFTDLAARSKSGDAIVVHFSSHGQQIMDNNRDELDGYDEAIVAYGAPAEYESNYFGEQHIRDEELGDYLNQVRKKIGTSGDMLVLVDACHSGTATRGPKARGGEEPFAPPGYSPPPVEKNTDVSIYDGQSMTAAFSEKGLSPMVVISAARAHELNYEYKGNGSLSLAFSRSFKNLNASTSYRSLFSKIVKEMSLIAPNQNPAVEGDIDRIILNGRVIEQEPFYSLSNLDMDAVSINGGVFTGLNEGYTIKVFPSGTVNTKEAKPITTGVVTFAEAFVCNAILDSMLEGSFNDYWVFVDQQSFGDLTMSFDISEVKDKAFIAQFTDLCANSPVLSIPESNADFIAKLNAGKLDIIRTQDLSVFAEGVRIDDDFRTFKRMASEHVQGKFIKEIELTNSAYAVEMELVPVRIGGGKVDTLNAEDYRDQGGIPAFAPGDKALIKITNHSSFPIYFNIIDIQPDGKINPVVPNPRKNENASDFKIKAGESQFIHRKFISFGPPYGLETFKIFASFEPLNFTPIFLTKGAASRGSFANELEKLFADSYAMSRGVDVGTISADLDACTFSYTFKIVEPIKN